MNNAKRLNDLISFVAHSTARAKGLLIPISGGSDSALAFWLLNQACGQKCLGIFCGRDLRCKEWFKNTGSIRLVEQPTFLSDRETARWALFHDLSLCENRWLVGTRNRSEDVFGTFSLASRIATFLPIVGVWKSDVMQLCKHVGIPDEITESSRRADPDCGRPAELAEIPLERIDIFLKAKLKMRSMRGLTRAEIAYLEHVFEANNFRHGLPVKGPV